ncbi:MAG: hypothetical protein ABIA93_04105 [Candidatus Woesearchaeota archaeon]
MQRKNTVSRSLDIPLKIFQDRNVAVMEALVRYLKDDIKLTNHEIAELINRDDRTIWTVYSRATKKGAKK